MKLHIDKESRSSFGPIIGFILAMIVRLIIMVLVDESAGKIEAIVVFVIFNIFAKDLLAYLVKKNIVVLLYDPKEESDDR